MYGPVLADLLSVSRDTFEFAYAAHTATCTFLLDQAGICRRVVMSSAKRPNEGKPLARCVGAQYVASLDTRAAGSLVELPRVGASMLFARVDDRGRVSLVRTGIVTKFESRVRAPRKPTHDPFAETDGVQTSAPDVAPSSTPRPRFASRPDFAMPPAGSPHFEEPTPVTRRVPEVAVEEEKTERMQSARRSDPGLEALERQAPPAPALPGMERTLADEDAIEIDPDDLATAEYPSAPSLLEPIVQAATARRPVAPAEARPRRGRRSEGSLRIAAARPIPEISEAPVAELKVDPRRRG